MDTISEENKDFYDRSTAILEEAHKRALTLEANTVQVWPGGATFKTIKEALDSITDASARLEYQVVVGPGTYQEQVHGKEYVYIAGAGAPKTTINPNARISMAGTIQMPGNSGISQVRIDAMGGKAGDTCYGILLLTPGQYHIKNVKIHSFDNNIAGINVRGISNYSGTKTGSAIINNCTVDSTADHAQSTPVAIEGTENGFSYSIQFCDIYTLGGTNGCGITTVKKATAVVNQSNITSKKFALYDMDSVSLITANGCTINGPVSPGVIVNP